MRISDWSSYVCSSDLPRAQPAQAGSHPPRSDRQVRPRNRYDPKPQAVDRGDLHGAATPSVRRLQPHRSEEHTSELQSLMRISYAVFCLKKKKKIQTKTYRIHTTNTY